MMEVVTCMYFAFEFKNLKLKVEKRREDKKKTNNSSQVQILFLLVILLFINNVKLTLSSCAIKWFRIRELLLQFGLKYATTHIYVNIQFYYGYLWIKTITFNYFEKEKKEKCTTVFLNQLPYCLFVFSSEREACINVKEYADIFLLVAVCHFRFSIGQTSKWRQYLLQYVLARSCSNNKIFCHLAICHWRSLLLQWKNEWIA